MKVSNSIEQIFRIHEDNAFMIQSRLKDHIDVWCKNHGWFFSDRVKKLESFAQKCQLSHIKIMDDVYAGTIIVKNRLEVMSCISLLKSDTCELPILFQKSRPDPVNKAINTPDSFVFDSARLYFKIKPPYDGTTPSYLGDLFEIQVKTLLDEAWEKVSHGFFYKTDDEPSWARSRVMFQIKALLENAEMAIVHAATMAESAILQKESEELKKLNDVNVFYKKYWQPDDLPKKDMRRLAESTVFLLDLLGQTVDELDQLIQDENADGRGAKIVNLSPYWSVVSSFARSLGWTSFLETVNNKLCSESRQKTFPLISELEIPDHVDLNMYACVKVWKLVKPECFSD